MTYTIFKLCLLRYEAYPNNTYNSTNVSGFKLEKNYNTKNGINDINLEDENEYNLNGMNYERYALKLLILAVIQAKWWLFKQSISF